MSAKLLFFQFMFVAAHSVALEASTAPVIATPAHVLMRKPRLSSVHQVASDSASLMRIQRSERALQSPETMHLKADALPSLVSWNHQPHLAQHSVKSPAERRFYRNQVNLHNAKARAKARAAQAVSEDLLPAKAVSNVTDATHDKEMMRKGAEVTTDAEEPSTMTLEIESSGSVQGKEKGIVNEDPETLVLQPATVPAPGVAAPVVAPAAPVAAAANPITAAQPAATAAAAAAQPATAAPAVDTAAAAASQAAPAAVPAAAAKPVAVAAVPGDVAQPATPAAAAAAPAAAGSTVTEKKCNDIRLTKRSAAGINRRAGSSRHYCSDHVLATCEEARAGRTPHRRADVSASEGSQKSVQ